MKFDEELNHSASHVLAMTVLTLFPDAKLGFCPPTKEGFYYDFKFSKPLLESDLAKIEKHMKKIIANPYIIKKMDSSYFYDFSNQPYKKELFDEFKEQNKDVAYYSIFNPILSKDLFVDPCVGRHIDNIKNIKHFKILSLAGAYWRGNSKNEQLTRIYGTAWETKEELDDFLRLLKERKERDHRKLGKELNLFMFDQLSGQGFPIWLEDGMKIKRRIIDIVLKLDRKYEFKEVSTPIIGEKKMYEISGHWEHYQDVMFRPIKCDNENLILRPMTCPHHILIYKSKKRSYKELPIRFSEQSPLFRYENSGALTGMERVRAMLLTEGHLFVRKDQIINEFKSCYKLIKEILNLFNIKIDCVSFSVRNPDDKNKYFDDDLMWDQAENDLRKVLKELKIDYVEMKGEAAFYGPKIDIQIKTALGHEITMSTLQLDFLLPKRFSLEFVNANNKIETPVMIHRGLIGTYERFLSVLLEQTKGVLPFWLAPKQVCLIPVNNEKHLKFAKEIYYELAENDFYVEIDERDERINKKIRDAQVTKTKIQIVIGDKEFNTKELALRFYGSNKITKINKKDLVNYLKVVTNERE